MPNCQTCARIAARNRGEAPPWDSIYRAQHWDVVHSYNSGLLGWLVVIARRHIAALDEMTDDEAVELGRMVRAVSNSLKAHTGCAKTYVVQFAEHPDHPHVHFHVIARMPEQPDDYKGPLIFRYLGVADAEHVSEAAMNALAGQVREDLERMLG